MNLAGRYPCPVPPVVAHDIVTPEPLYPQPTPSDNIPPRMAGHDDMRLRAAIHRATRRYPGPVGKLIERELVASQELGRLVHGSLIADLVDEVMRPTETAASSL